MSFVPVEGGRTVVGTRKSHLAAAQAGPSSMLSRRLLGVTAAVVLGVASLSGCAAGMISQTADQVPNHDGTFAEVGPIRVSNATFGDANDRPGPVAFATGTAVPLTLWVTNTAIAADTVTSISTSAGKVTLSGDAVVPAQGRLEIGPEGVKAQIDSATADVKYGMPVTVEIYFANAGKLTLEVPVAIPAERNADRAGTHIYPSEHVNLWEENNTHNG